MSLLLRSWQNARSKVASFQVVNYSRGGEYQVQVYLRSLGDPIEKYVVFDDAKEWNVLKQGYIFSLELNRK